MLCENIFKTPSLPNTTPILGQCSQPSVCHVSCVTCQMSGVRCKGVPILRNDLGNPLINNLQIKKHLSNLAFYPSRLNIVRGDLDYGALLPLAMLRVAGLPAVVLEDWFHPVVNAFTSLLCIPKGRKKKI